MNGQRRYPSVAALSPAAHAAVVRGIFSTVHDRYDFLNHLLSLRRDIGWRAAAVERMRLERTRRFLDVATGTADLAIAAARRHPGIEVTGVDMATPMLEIGRTKVRAAGLEDRVCLQKGDALSLPFADAAFDVSAMAFGMRNIPDRHRALKEMARVTVAGGQVMVLEMTFFPAAAIRPLYGIYLDTILPNVARLFQRSAAAYAYLADSIRSFPAPEGLRTLMAEAGLRDISYYRLSFGTAYLHVGHAPGGA